MPFTHASEAILITVAASLKILACMPVNFAKALIKPPGHKTPEMRMSELKQRLRKDILLAVSSMIAGYPERASLVFTDQWIARQQGSYNPLMLEQETAVQK